MSDDALGKGEVESSILSCSTIKRNKNKTIGPKAEKSDCADLGVNDSGTVARNWQANPAPFNAPVRAGYLYRYWSERGTLLYIGISVNAVARLGQHRNQEWFPRIARIDVQKFDTYEEAECAELQAICYEGPIHNVKGPREAKDVGPALSKLRAAQRRRATKVPPKYKKMYEAYTIDLYFKAIPPGTSFETYLVSPEMHGEVPGW